MDNFFKNQLYRWTYDKLKEKPEVFGSDGCNALYMHTYLKEYFNIKVPIHAIKVITTISRIKSRILLENPQWDSRVKDRPKKKKLNENHSYNLPTNTADR